MTPLQIKCSVDSVTYMIAQTNRFYYYNSPLQVGEALYIVNSGVVTPLSGTTFANRSFINRPPFDDFGATLTFNINTDRVITLSNGVVTAITYFSNLPSC